MKDFDIFIVQKLINFLNRYLLFRKKPVAGDASYNFPEGVEKIEYNVDNAFKINLYKDSVLSKMIYSGFEEKESSFIIKLIKPDDIFFDIGSNIGIHSFYAAKALKNTGAIYAFEPTLTTYNRLVENIDLNNWASIIHPYNIGLSNKTEKLVFHTSTDGYDAWNSFADLEHVTLNNQIEVNVTSFDEFIKENTIPYNKISLIKIDVEGWELMVLKGVESLFLNDGFNASFLVEFTEENAFRAGYSCRDLFSYMTERGYMWFDYDIETNTLKGVQLKAYYPYENLIAVKQSRIQFVNNSLSNSEYEN
jgi:FkbM family methyltransferase